MTLEQVETLHVDLPAAGAAVREVGEPRRRAASPPTGTRWSWGMVVERECGPAASVRVDRRRRRR